MQITCIGGTLTYDNQRPVTDNPTHVRRILTDIGVLVCRWVKTKSP